MVKKILSDQRGMAMVFPIMFLMLVVFAGLVLDIGRTHIIRGQMQTVVDSSSLAGSMTAEAKYDSRFDENQYSVPVYGSSTVTDEDGNTHEVPVIVGYNDYVDIKQTFTKPETVITDPQKAKDAAVTAALANSPGWAGMGVAQFDQGYHSDSLHGTGYAGHVISQDRTFPGVQQTRWPGFYSEMRASVKPGFLSFIREDEIPVRVESESIAILRPDTERERAGAEITVQLPADVEAIKENLRNDPSAFWNPLN